MANSWVWSFSSCFCCFSNDFTFRVCSYAAISSWCLHSSSLSSCSPFSHFCLSFPFLVILFLPSSVLEGRCDILWWPKSSQRLQISFSLNSLDDDGTYRGTRRRQLKWGCSESKTWNKAAKTTVVELLPGMNNFKRSKTSECTLNAQWYNTLVSRSPAQKIGLVKPKQYGSNVCVAAVSNVHAAVTQKKN